MKSPILALTHACVGKDVACSCFCSYRQYINIHDAHGLYDRLITATRAAKMQDAEMCEQNQAMMFYSLSFNTKIVSVMYTDYP